MRVAAVCHKHGFYLGANCEKCESEFVTRGRGKMSIMVNTDKWVSQGEYEHIDPTMPHMRFDSKNDLKRECEKRGLLVKCLMKPVSRGKGFEHAKR